MSVANASQRLDEVEHRPHRNRGDRDQTWRRLPGPDVRECVDELADGVVTVGFIASGILDHASEDLQRDTRCEAGHHRVGDEVHHRPEPQQPEQQHDGTRDEHQCCDIGGIGRVEARGAQDALGRQRERTGSVVTINTVRANSDPTIVDTTPE